MIAVAVGITGILLACAYGRVALESQRIARAALAQRDEARRELDALRGHVVALWLRGEVDAERLHDVMHRPAGIKGALSVAGRSGGVSEPER